MQDHVRVGQGAWRNPLLYGSQADLQQAMPPSPESPAGMGFAITDRMPPIWPRNPAASAIPNLHQLLTRFESTMYQCKWAKRHLLNPNPPIGSWESLVDVVAGSSPVGGTRSYCIPNRAGESQFPSVSPPEPTIGLSPRVRGNLRNAAPCQLYAGSIPACAGEPASLGRCRHR